MTEYSSITNQIIEVINNTNKFSDIDEGIIWQTYYKNKKKCPKNCGSELKILILNAPCNGFGDVIFGIKIANYIRDWYGAKVIIASTFSSGFITLGESPENLLQLIGKKTQCRRFKTLEFQSKPNDIFDLILVAPVQADFEVKISDVKALINYSNIFNTYFFSEYNDEPDKYFDFPTGIGYDNLGLLLTSPVVEGRLESLPNPYAVVYIAETIDYAPECFFSFFELIIVKYKKHSLFDIVIPSWILKENLENIISDASQHFSNIDIVDKNKNRTRLVSSNNNKTLTLRADIYPLSNPNMLKLMKYSVKDILLTGDQSITDALSCCNRKNIFYQIAPWKKDFGYELAKNLPNKFLFSEKTACGTLLAIKYNSDYRKFVKKWDFRKLGKPKMDAIILATIARKNSNKLKNIENAIQSSRTLKTLQKKINLIQS